MGWNQRSRSPEYVVRKKDEIPDYVVIQENAKIVELDCLDEIRVWVFQGRADDSESENPGSTGWEELEGITWSKESRAQGNRKNTYSKLIIKEAHAHLKSLMIAQPKKWYELPRSRVLQAMCEVTLKDPGQAWSKDMNCNDSWVFPLEIGFEQVRVDNPAMQSEGNRRIVHHRFCFRRPLGERGEVPDWGFLNNHLDSKKYNAAGKIINPWQG
jgi:hypothetical protein